MKSIKFFTILFATLFCLTGCEIAEYDYDVSGTLGGYKYVDMGLSVKWATYNVGAVTPEAYGDYFAWGETKAKESYTESNSTMMGNSTIGTITGDARYDAARARWGGNWRMPTVEEQQELLNNCNHEWTSRNGVDGILFTSRENGNSIFLPAAGCRHETLHDGTGTMGGYWSATPNDTVSNHAHYLFFDNDEVLTRDWRSRNYGHSIRPVAE